MCIRAAQEAARNQAELERVGQALHWAIHWAPWASSLRTLKTYESPEPTDATKVAITQPSPVALQKRVTSGENSNAARPITIATAMHCRNIFTLPNQSAGKL